MNTQLLKNMFGWGFFLWLFGFILGILLFMFVPMNMIGWVIAPIGTVMTLWVLQKKIHGIKMNYYFLIGVGWLLIAIVCDYIFLVKVFNPIDGYYKPSVYLYYSLTLFLPLVVGLKKQKA